MPCVAPVKGNLGVTPPYCGLPTVTSIGGQNVSADNLCLFHVTLKRGQADMKPPVVQEAV